MKSPASSSRAETMADRIPDPPPQPWYREPWPWILMAGPLAVVAGGMVTLWLALESDDGLVTDNYYRRGLAINQTLSRERFAARLNYNARVTFSADARQVRVALAGTGALPGEVRLRLAHPTRAGMDQVLALRAVTPGVFETELDAPITGRRVLLLEDAARTWRLSGETPGAAGSAVVLTPGNG